MLKTKQNCAKITLCAVILVVAMMVTSALATAATPKYSTKQASNEFLLALNALESVYYEDIDFYELLSAALTAAFGELDEYTEYMTEEEYNEYFGIGQVSKAGIGISMRLNKDGNAVVLDVFEDSPAEKAGIKAKDILLKVNGDNIAGHNLNELRDLISGEVGTTAVITVLRGAAEKEITVKRGAYQVQTVIKKDISTLLEGADDKKAAYIEISTFVNMPDKPELDSGKIFKRMYDDIKKSGVKNLIIDLRSNPGGDLETLVTIAEMLVKEGVIFQTVDGQGIKTVFSSEKKEKDFNLAVLVNGETASSSEILAQAIKESDSGTIVGTTTFGKGVGQVIVPAPDNTHYMKITAFEVFTRNGAKLNNVGVKPNIVLDEPPYIKSEGIIDNNADADDIKMLRNALSYIGYTISKSKKSYDAELTNAVTEFQLDAKIQPSGLCTTETRDILNRYVMDKYLEHDEILEAAYRHLGGTVK